ncbi:MAG: RNA methyltransferase [bacterium]|nr:RNA methyltransferase [bacterium]
MCKTIYLILHNIRSAYNVGSIFRTADGAGVAKIFICGISPTPEDAKVLKTSLSAEKTVPWEYHAQTWRLLEKLKKDGLQIVALEQAPKSIDYRKFKLKLPLALIVGNEVHGLNKKILSLADKIIEIPMYGKKESLNVAVAIGIALYKLLENK